MGALPLSSPTCVCNLQMGRCCANVLKAQCVLLGDFGVHTLPRAVKKLSLVVARVQPMLHKSLSEAFVAEVSPSVYLLFTPGDRKISQLELSMVLYAITFRASRFRGVGVFGTSTMSQHSCALFGVATHPTWSAWLTSFTLPFSRSKRG